jgi:glycosyltransferase involved in cell wall biosynthesis
VSVVDPHVSIVIPTYQRRQVVGASLDAWLAQRFERTFEVIIVDDGSEDGTADALAARARSEPRLTVVTQLNRGRAATRNAGLRRAQGEWLLFADDDVVPRGDDVLARWYARAAASDGAWVPRVFVPAAVSRTFVQRAWRERAEAGFRRWRDGQRLGAGGFWFASLLVRRRDVGDERFDEGFGGYGWEDLELGYRLHRRGVTVRLARDIEVEHVDAIEFEGLEDKHEAYGRQGWHFARRHPRLAVLIWTGTWWPVRLGKALVSLERRGAARRERVLALAPCEDEKLDPAFASDLRIVLEAAYARGVRTGAPGAGPLVGARTED